MPPLPYNLFKDVNHTYIMCFVDQPAITDHISAILCGYKSKQHLPLMQRKVCGKFSIHYILPVKNRIYFNLSLKLSLQVDYKI